jgi:hypothetical protein
MSTEKLDKLSRYLEEECREMSEEKRAHIWILAFDVGEAIPKYMGD